MAEKAKRTRTRKKKVEEEKELSILERADEFKKKGVTFDEELTEMSKKFDGLVIGFDKSNEEHKELIGQIKRLYSNNLAVQPLSELLPSKKEKTESHKFLKAIYLSGPDSPIKVEKDGKLVLVASCSNQIGNDTVRKNLDITYLNGDSMESVTVGMNFYENIREAFMRIPTEMFPSELSEAIETQKSICKKQIDDMREHAEDSNDPFGSEEYDRPNAPRAEDMKPTTEEERKCPFCGRNMMLVGDYTLYCPVCGQDYMDPLAEL